MNDTQKQCLLTFLGYDTGGIGNGWGSKSRDAVEQCQEDLGILADGVWGKQTEAAVLEAVYTYDDVPESDTTGTFWNHIRYWSREEFRCQCGGKYCDGFPVEPDQTLVELVDDIRHAAGRPGHRSSGLRCKVWNGLQGGVGNSKHMSGKALDFYIEGLSGTQLLALAQKDSRTSYAYIIDGQYVHVDVK